MAQGWSVRCVRRGAAVAVLAALAAAGAAVPARAGETPVTAFVTVNDSGSYLRPPTHRLYRSGEHRFVFDGTGGKAWLDLLDAGSDQFDFRAPAGLTLERGSYEGTVESRYDDPARPVLSFTGADNCYTHDSRFVVHDVALDAAGTVTRFLATYELRCAGEQRALTGQVGVNVPLGALHVYNAAPRFPETYPRSGGRDAHVWLHNRSARAVTVGTPSVTGTDARAYGVAGNTCGTLAPGATCAVRVRFRPPGGRTYVAALSIPTSAGTRTVPLSGRGIPGHTAIHLRSELGDWAGAGGRYDYSPATSYWETAAQPGRFWARMHLRPLGLDSVELVPPAGTRFTPGTYTGVGRPGYTDRAAASVGISWRGCLANDGTLTVLEAAYDEAGALARFAATFELSCENGTDHLHGWVSWRATHANVPPPGLTPPPVANLRAAATGYTAKVAWDLPPGVDSVAVRAGVDVVWPADGVHLFTGRASSLTVGPIPDGHSMVVSVFGVGADRHVAPVRKIRLRGSALMVATSARAVTYGEPVTFRARLVDAFTRKARPYQPVVLHARRPGGEWFALRTLTTDREGRAAFRFAPRRTYEYQATYGGRRLWLGATSRPDLVAVRPRVTAALDRATVPAGGAVEIRGAVAPAEAGSSVYVQRWVDGAWRTVAARVVSEAGTYAATFRPGTAGTWRLRAYVPADAAHAAGASPVVTLAVT